ncbi:PSD1 and planctomycete cytochrome C domain-containing protein [Brevifollis gellanilyticus]|uniref:Peptidyl-prolyl cis-trans isomerase n=1 Tax=Brevifollis gellanilyticus TaxID=748831 RepID=A0A512M3T3_9BACT|nr:PSD1 and planctomycete cytochrome C domain-containing protein [Brevifollis gellanilyticus]GEP40981.1 peptidyl-prolyl cis-trans isomerase [Brevifollis gellanilyticus]
MSPHRPTLIFLLTAATLATVPASAQDKPTFNRDIRPILSENCFACHGFDSKKREADLRLDTPEGAFTETDGIFPIKPGDLTKSEVWQRIITTDEDDLMPPKDSHKKLTQAQKDTLKRWIEQGATYQKHWAFESPALPPIPSAQAPSNSPIDAFLAARQNQDRLNFADEAPKETLIRRVAFTLTGLPPTLAEVDAFLKDTSPKAYEAMVDRYMQSPRYGEEMAKHWLDVARYADTHGLHLDNERTMWAYRDWVVRAFNANLPFDQFTVWQLAGDLLPNATTDQITATGFSRCNVTTSEGGAIDEEYRHLYAIDRASTLTTAWMGLTGGCAQCHDHKYDPLTTAEFYSLYAFFYSGADPAMDKNIATTEPFQRLPKDNQQKTLEAAIQAEAEALKALDASAQNVAYADPATLKPAPEPQPSTQVLFDDAFPIGTDVRNTSRNPSAWVSAPDYGTKSGSRVLTHTGGQLMEDVITLALTPLTVPESPRISVWARTDPQSPPRVLSIVSGGRRVFWGEENALADIPAGPITQVTHAGPLPKPGTWTQLSFDPSVLELKVGSRISTLSIQQYGGIVAWDLCTLTGNLRKSEDTLASFSLWWKAVSSGKKVSADVPADLLKPLTTDPAKHTKLHIADVRAKAPKPAAPLTPEEEAKAVAAAKREAQPTIDKEREALLGFYLARIAHPANEDIATKRKTWEAAKVARSTADYAISGTFVFRDMETPRETFVAMRGQYNKLGDKVVPSTPAFLPKLAQSTERASRLDLAKWLVAPEHPLTSRVTVNRFWQQIFGIGLVKTSHDFGSQSEPPSHAELLDYLAVSFQKSGWDIKRLIKELLMTQAFRQDCKTSFPTRSGSGSDNGLENPFYTDPENRLLARGPRIRLDAEQIRDNALFVSGLINLEVGGRGVRTYQPPNIWEPVGYGDSNTRYYLQDHGPSLYRRSLYSFLKRTAPPPFMSNFDAPNREQSCTRRERSNTPLQALQLMNDVQHFEAARALAERTLQEGGKDDAARLNWLFRTVLSRDPDAQESTMLTAALLKQRELYKADPAAAEKAIHTGESKPKGIASPIETASWTLMANLVLNLDETVMRN